MSIEKITAYPEITKTVIEGDNVVSVTQGDYDLGKVIAHIETSIAMVRRYEKMGYYTLSKPEFVSEVITTFTDLEVNKKDVIRANNFMDIQGYQECNRVWQLPDEMKVQVSQMLYGFYITYDEENWEDFSVEMIDDNS
jgi:hypothetical protein